MSRGYASRASQGYAGEAKVRGYGESGGGYRSRYGDGLGGGMSGMCSLICPSCRSNGKVTGQRRNGSSNRV